jgi:hypothetical protein
MAKAKIVQVAEKHDLMRSDALWLTTGGRIVKPTWGEYASETHKDILVLTPYELEHGVKLDVFHKRYMAARRKWKRRYAKRTGKGCDR